MDTYCTKNSFVTLVGLFLVFIFFVVMGWSYGRVITNGESHYAKGVDTNATSSALLVRYHREGLMQLAVVPITSFSGSDNMIVFNIALNDPSYGLARKDWVQTAYLKDGAGNVWKPEFAGTTSEGYLLGFNVVNPVSIITLGLGGVKEEFSWQMP